MSSQAPRSPDEPAALIGRLDALERHGIAIPAQHQEAMRALLLARDEERRGDLFSARLTYRRAATLERIAALALKGNGASAALAMIAEAGARAALSAHDLGLAIELARLGLSENPPADLRWRLGMSELEAILRGVLDKAALWAVEFPEGSDVDLILRSGGRRLEIQLGDDSAILKSDPLVMRVALSPDCEPKEAHAVLDSWLASTSKELFTTWADERFLATAA